MLAVSHFASGHDHPDRRGPEFHENRGQWADQVLYRAYTPGGAVFVEPDAFTYVLRSGGQQHARPKDEPYEPYRMHAYRMSFVGGNAKAHSGTGRSSHYVNYFHGNDPSKWAGGVGVFAGVELNEVYPGIDLHVGGAEGLKYDWIVQPGSDASMIRMRFDGQDGVAVEEGLLYIRTSAGVVIEQRPVAWTVENGAHVPVKCAYELVGNELRYAFPEGFDRKQVLVIDPTVIFSSYTGSTADNFGFTATYDDDGHLYAGGIVFGIGYPITLGVLQPNFGGDVIDIGISKFSPDGSTLVWSTYLGGGLGNESPHSMVVNSAGELFVMGTTGSSDFPLTSGCFDNSFGFGPAVNFTVWEGYVHNSGADIVISHFSADATQLLGSTYIGGSQADGLNMSGSLDYNYGDPFRGEIILDSQERPIVVTSTHSPDMPISAGASQPTLGGGQDGYACMLDPSLSNLLWGTYYGGSLDDTAFGVQQDGNGRIFITGGTLSANLPMAGTPMIGTAPGGVDGYIARFEPDGGGLSAATYLGTPFYDQSYFVQIDLAGAVYVVGQTHGGYPVSSGVYANPAGSQFIHKLGNDLSTSIWSTRIGSSGTEDIAPAAFLVSDCGQIYFSGWGGSTNNYGQPNVSTTFGLPVTPDAHQPITDGSDFYLMVLNADAASLAYATFFGGTSAEHVDGGTSRFDKDGIVYQAVCAGCQQLGYPTTPGAYSQTNNSFNCNLGAFKIDFEQNVQVNIDANISVSGACITEPIVFNAIGTADEWAWDLGDGTLSSETTFAHLYDEPGTYIVTLIGTATGLCVAVDSATLVINVVAPAIMNASFAAVPTGDCNAVSVDLANTSSGSTDFFWTFGDGTTSTITNPTHPYGSPGDYTIILAVIDPVCTDTVFFTQTISVGIPDLVIDLGVSVGLCDDQPVQLSAPPGFDTYLWSTGDPSMIITVEEAGVYSVVVTDGFCIGSDSVTVTPPVTYVPFTDRSLCPGETAVLAPPFIPQDIVWSNGSQNTSITTTTAGTYWFQATDPNGCVVTDTVQVSFATLATGDVLIPNVFTPNGDGYNDVFLVENVDAADFHMDVYNRWGMKVFSSTSSGKGWNGKLDNDGETVPDGTYFVVIGYTAYCSNKGGITCTGHVTLLR